VLLTTTAPGSAIFSPGPDDLSFYPLLLTVVVFVCPHLELHHGCHIGAAQANTQSVHPEPQALLALDRFMSRASSAEVAALAAIDPFAMEQ
jgi:hypothetical protein